MTSFLRRLKASTICSTSARVSGAFMLRSTPIWLKVEMQVVVYWWTFSRSLVRSAGAARKPILQPVMAKALEKPFMVMVRSHIPGRAAMEQHSAPS